MLSSRRVNSCAFRAVYLVGVSAKQAFFSCRNRRACAILCFAISRALADPFNTAAADDDARFFHVNADALLVCLLSCCDVLASLVSFLVMSRRQHNDPISCSGGGSRDLRVVSALTLVSSRRSGHSGISFNSSSRATAANNKYAPMDFLHLLISAVKLILARRSRLPKRFAI